MIRQIPQFIQLLLLVVALSGSIGNVSAQTSAPERPNVILILVDDMGFSDLGFIGGDIETPNIDQLARQGLFFEQFYNNAKCSQTRASLLSGLYFQQALKDGPSGNLGHNQLARNNHTTIAEILKSAGYATSLAGKWHLSSTPYEQGFDRFYGFLDGSGTHWYSPRVFGDFHVAEDEFYSSDAYTDAGMAFIEEGIEAGKPFFLYLSYPAPHFPLHAPPEDIEKYRGRFQGGWSAVRQRRIENMKAAGWISPDFQVLPMLEEAQAWDASEKPWQWSKLSPEEQAEQEQIMEVYAAMMDRVDQNIGRLMVHLSELGAADNTLVMFLSDNGGSPYAAQDEPGQAAGPAGSFRTLNTPWAQVNSAPFALFKRYSHEGGISTPLIAHWPAGLKQPGRSTAQPFHVIDFMPTLLELAGAEYPAQRHGDPVLPMAGESFKPQLLNQESTSERTLFWDFQDNFAIRQGPWKLVQSNISTQWALFNMDTDRGETHDLASEHVERAQHMQARWESWRASIDESKTLEAPHWQVASAWPDRVVATVTETPGNSFSVSWRTDVTVEQTAAQISLARAAARFDIGAKEIKADTEVFTFGQELVRGKRGQDSNPLIFDPVAYHSVTFDDLQADTRYAYRVQGAEGQWSPWRQLRTTPAEGSVKFLYFGDTQQGIRSHVSRLFETAAVTAPDADFMLHTGDLVTSGVNDLQWAEWFEAGQPLLGRIPAMPVPGNHDYSKVDDSDRAVLTPFWQPQFRLPTEPGLPPELQEAVYDVRVNPQLHVFAIDSSGPDFARQMEWLSEQVEASDAHWRVVFMHHPFFSWVGDGVEKPDQTKRRALFDAFLENHDVDLVLTGHRHSYQRAERGQGVHVQDKKKPYAVDSVLLVTASTTQRGKTKVDGWERFAQERDGTVSLTRWGDFVPLFGVFELQGNELKFKALDALGDTYDEFTLVKDDSGVKTLHNGPAAFGPVWNEETVGPYLDQGHN